MSQLRQSSVRNRLLAVLAPSDFDALAPALQPVELPLREVLLTAHQPITHAYFLESGLCSIISDTQGGRIEVGLTGREGFVGVPLVLSSDRTVHTLMVQAEAKALRISADDLLAVHAESPGLRSVLGRYVYSLMVQVGQTVHANADLNVEGRLARWILMTHDRLGQGELPLTHEFLAMMLGVRRTGVTGSIHLLEGAGLIKARRGRITVLDRERLEEMAGDTYGVAEAEYERLFAQA